MKQVDPLPTLTFDSQERWEEWLAQNHATSPGVWIKMAKKDSGIPSVNHPQAIESALCYGWIDGQRNGLDETYFLQKFTPRRPRSGWSKINVEKVAELIAAGRMQPAGLREVEQAKADGRWDAAYDSQSRITVPDDFQQALDEHPAARDFFAALKGSNRYAFLYRLQTTKRAETRAAKIQKFIGMLERGETFH